MAPIHSNGKRPGTCLLSASEIWDALYFCFQWVGGRNGNPLENALWAWLFWSPESALEGGSSGNCVPPVALSRPP